MDRCSAFNESRGTLVNAGTDNSLLDFAAIINELDLLISSDSVAMHIAIIAVQDRTDL